MYKPSLSFLRSVVHHTIKQVRIEPIKKSSNPATVYRLWLEASDRQSPRSLIVKRIDDNWPEDPQGHKREAHFYGQVLPQLDIPQPRVYFTGKEPGSAHQLVIMEDLGLTHYFPEPNHTWKQIEIEQILRTYARLHVSGKSYIREAENMGWMMDRHEKRLLKTADHLPSMVQTLTANEQFPRLTKFDDIVEKTLGYARDLSDQPITVLHNDVYTPNSGLPLDRMGEVILVDWEMVSRGLAEIDLGFMFLQPFGSHTALDRHSALSYYWNKREHLEGHKPSRMERELRQWYADALWALWLIPVAYRVHQSPYPPTSQPGIYWAAMMGVLGHRLQQLCRET